MQFSRIGHIVLLPILIGLIAVQQAFSQSQEKRPPINFYHLTTAQGLSDNYVRDMGVDKSGNLWVGTQDGLNMFNGRSVTWFLREKYPQLPTDYIVKVFPDELNRIWVFCQGGNPVLIDQNRRFHKIALYNDTGFISSRWMLDSKEHGSILFTREGFFVLDKTKDITVLDSLGNDCFKKLNIPGLDTLQARRFSQIEYFDDDRFILSIEDGFFLIDFRKKQLSPKYPFPNLYILGQALPGELLVYDKQVQELHSINLATQAVSWPFRDTRDQHGLAIGSRILNARMIDKENLLMSSQLSGLYRYNWRTRQLTSYRRNAADPHSILNNLPRTIRMGRDGWVFIAASPNGFSYFNTNAVVNSQPVFFDNKGQNYDSWVSGIATRNENEYYIGTATGLLKWNRSTNITEFVDYAEVNGKKMMDASSVGFFEFDPLNRLWFRNVDYGMFVLGPNDKAIKTFLNDTTDPNGMRTHRIFDIVKGPDNKMWVATAKGIRHIDPISFKIDYLEKTALSQLKNIVCATIYFEDNDNMWIGTDTRGLWHYRISTDSIRNLNTKNGLMHNQVLAIKADGSGNLFVGTNIGLQIFYKNGGERRYTNGKGLRHGRAEVLILDRKNRMWVGNDVGIACYNIADSSLRYFDETYGLSIQGFRVTSYWVNKDGEQFWGTERGIQYFYPDELHSFIPKQSVSIDRIESRNVLANTTGSQSFELRANDNYITFYFGVTELVPRLRTFYQYKLQGLDRDWISVVNQNFVRYSSLPAGTYTFKVRASSDNETWFDSGNEITIKVAKPLLQQWWVRLGGLLLGVLLIAMVVNFYKRKQERKRKELEAELVITYFASQINKHHRTDELLWDVAKNCISKLKFEDCVIYLKDPTRNVLVQKAAYGPKNPVDFTIHRPIDIAVGEGIVGAVGKTGKYELVNDTQQDERYIVDDAKRFSEIAVPIVVDGEVIGVIDSEHTQKNFFTNQHLQVLSTVAVLCANQIQRTRAEEEKHKTKLELLENKQKATESRLQSLRLQMNPHFLFNALNSIQQMILANEDIVATKYLSRFSKLLRAILVHSDKESISLKEELEILKLYIELESIRFKDSFHYSVEVDEDIETDEVKIPTLLVQPFVENAIWHGLMHKEGERKLLVEFREDGDFIKCVIEDNGVGRKKAAAMKLTNGQGKQHTSKGIAVSKERLKALRTADGREGAIEIIDLETPDGTGTGTRVEIDFPIQN
jgi:ligand-binding sensor domain-containing protein/putative methionine-R-sulfoxide reductase with GAF domain